MRCLLRPAVLVFASVAFFGAVGCTREVGESEVRVTSKEAAPKAPAKKKKKSKKKGNALFPITARPGEFDFPAWVDGDQKLAMPAAVAGGPAPLVANWQRTRRTELADHVRFSYEGKVEIEPAGKPVSRDGHERAEFRVLVDGKTFFRYFRLAPKAEGVPAAAANAAKGAAEPAKAPPAEAAPARALTQAPKKLPTVVAFMSHGKIGDLLDKADSDDRAAASALADRGYLVFAMENAAMGPEDSALTHRALDDALRMNGSSWYGLVITHARLLLDQVFKDPEVDAKRVGALGVSTGGLLALVSGALDPRIQAVSAQGIMGSWRDIYGPDHRGVLRNKLPRHHCRCGRSLNLLPDFDMPELAAMIAPRPLHVTLEKEGAEATSAKRALELVEPIFAKFKKQVQVEAVPNARWLLAENAESFFGAAFGLKPAAEPKSAGPEAATAGAGKPARPPGQVGGSAATKPPDATESGSLH